MDTPDEKDIMVAAIRAIMKLFEYAGLNAGQQAGCLTFVAKWLIVHQPNPAAAEAEFVQKLADQTLPDMLMPKTQDQNAPKAQGMN